MYMHNNKREEIRLQIIIITGQVGITLNTDWQVPKNPENPSDLEASKRAIDFMLGWFLNPVMKGDYPKVMRDQVDRKSREQGLPTSRLPRFTQAEQMDIKGVLMMEFNLMSKGGFK